jgi:calcineurin-like phosphoesterase family protein
MIKTLYEPFRKWSERGTVWIYSDPHFSDPDMVELRKNYIGDDEQVARINSKVGKHDTIIFLGDIGNVDMIRKIRGYKVLIMGNHDKGASKYERKRMIGTCYHKDRWTKQEALELVRRRRPTWRLQVNDDDKWWTITGDNGLFDEVYEGPLFIADKLLLSHEPIDLPFAFNIHGHDHSGWHGQDGHHLNVCAEHIDYYPVNFNRLLKGGLLSKVDSIHRMTIDNAVERKKERGEGVRLVFHPIYPDESVIV